MKSMILAAVLAASAGMWASVPTSVLVKEISTTVKGRTVTFIRELPFGAVTAQWQSEITMIDSSFECNSGGWGVARYQPVIGNTVRYDLDEWADPCLDSEGSYYLTNIRRVLVLGVIPMPASVTVTTVLRE